MCKNNASIISDIQKEETAITVMRSMLTKYASDLHISFEEAMLRFSHSITYNMLFDYETGVWKEGPDYLRGLYEDELNNQIFLNNTSIES